MDLNLDAMTTETRNQATMDLDTMTPLEVVTAMNREDAKVPQAIHSQLPQIAQAVEWAIQSFKDGGRMFYMGAGTSGRLGVLDAAECPPTFGVSPNVVVGLIAGGEPAFTKAVEGAEDSREMGRGDLESHGLTAETSSWAWLPAAGPLMYWADWNTPGRWGAIQWLSPATQAPSSDKLLIWPLRRW